MKRCPIPDAIRLQVIAKSNNRCCVCQTPFLQIHHLDEDPSNNAIDNLAPLCPNCHSQAHARAAMTTNLTTDRIIALRDRWYSYCERRQEGSAVGPNAMLKLKNFVRSMGYAQYGWSRTFADVDPAYKEMTREEIINRAFSTSNRDDLVSYLETVKQMYQIDDASDEVLERFRRVCSAFAIDYAELE